MASSPRRHDTSPCQRATPIINYISTTATKTGLRIDSHLIPKDYPTGIKISDKEMKDLSLHPHDTQPTRNYTISPT